MAPAKTNQKLKFIGAAALATAMFSGCMTQAELDALNASMDIGAGATPVPAPSVGPACFNERFIQPDAQISRSVDLLFVMDTSGSMSDNRAKVAAGISAFVGELPSQVDYQIAVMLAHGSKPWSGKLFTYGGATIFSSKTMSLSTIQSKLSSMVLHTPTDSGIEQGEEGSYSLLKGLTTNLAANVAAGFFRPTAALAVVYVSDENDICAPYVNQPTMPGLTSAEKTLRNRDCPGGIATKTVLDQVKSLQKTNPYVFGAVTHEQINYSDAAGNDSYGWGYMDYVQATNGVSTEINDGDYTTGLSNLGKLATSKLNLVLDFTLARNDFDPSTLNANVDGTSIGFVFDPASNDVHLDSGGGARSTVDINYCLKQDLPPSAAPGAPAGGSTPDPTGTPSPTPTPTPTPTYYPPAS